MMCKKLLLAGMVGLALAGCACPSFVKGVRSGVGTIGPEYRAYVLGDSSLGDADRKIRLRTLEELEKLIEEAGK